MAQRMKAAKLEFYNPATGALRGGNAPIDAPDRVSRAPSRAAIRRLLDQLNLPPGFMPELVRGDEL